MPEPEATALNRRSFLAAGLGAAGLRAAAPDASELTRLTLAEAGQLVRAKKASPLELTRACLDRIERLNPKLNAFITVTAETALAEARRAEGEIARGNWRGPLHGVPVALKDIIDTAGVRTTAGSAVYADRVPAEDADVVRRLKEAGAVLLGKLNTHEFAYGGTSAVTHFGAVHNPWKLEHIPGGSSGGSGAAVSAELCYGALGTDTGGSIRGPATHCGIVGLKPTYGRVSARGVIPLSWSQDHVGPMTRRVADAALMLQVLAGFDVLDPASVDASVPDYTAALGRPVASLRLGVPRTSFYEKLHPQVEAAVNEALQVLGKLTRGHRDIDLPVKIEVATKVRAAEAAAYHAPHLARTPELYQPDTLTQLRRGAEVSVADYVEAKRELELLRRSVVRVFDNVDLLITPTVPEPAATIVNAPRNLNPLEPSRTGRNTRAFNLFGLPAISVPCGFTRDGLPIGLQIAGRHWGEENVLALAHAYEQATEWHRRRPPVA